MTNKHRTVPSESAATAPPQGVYVIACPRSGTGYASQIFQAACFDVGHERMGRFGTSDFRQITHAIPDQIAVLHQVRHPLHCMTSLQTIMDSSFQWLVRRIAFAGIEFDATCRLETVARIWLHYNAQCESIADVTYRVECESDWLRACRLVGLPPIDRCKTPTTYNSRRGESRHRHHYKDPVTWHKLDAEVGRHLCAAIQRMARRYGYEV